MAKKVKTKTFSFKGRVKKDVENTKSKAKSYGYLKLPSGVGIFKPEKGKMNVDIIPYFISDNNHPDKDAEAGINVKGDLWYKRPFKIHRSIGPNNDSVVCLSSIGKKCPICEYRAKLLKEGAPQKETDALRASERVLYNVIPKGHKKMDEKIHIWDMSYSLFQKKLNTEIEENEEFENFPSATDGYTLKIRFEEQSLFKTTFQEATRIDFEERDEQYEESIYGKAADLDQVLNILSYEQLDKLFLELDDADVEEEDEEPKRKSKSMKNKKRPEPEDEDEDDEDEDEDDEDEEDEEVEEEEEEEVEEEEEEEEDDEDEEEEDDEDEEEEDDEDEEEEDDEDEEEEEEPVRKRKPTKSSKTSKKKEVTGNKCPHGHKFGKDCEKFDECDDCELWEKCYEKQNE